MSHSKSLHKSLAFLMAMVMLLTSLGALGQFIATASPEEAAIEIEAEIEAEPEAQAEPEAEIAPAVADPNELLPFHPTPIGPTDPAVIANAPIVLTPPRNEGQLARYVGNPGMNWTATVQGNNSANPLRVEEIGTPSFSGPAIFGLPVGSNMYMIAPTGTINNRAVNPAASAALHTQSVANVKVDMTLDAEYGPTPLGIMALQFEEDLNSPGRLPTDPEGTDFWMDRVIARRGANPALKINSRYAAHSAQHEGHDGNLLLTRGRALYSKYGTASGLGFNINSMYTRNANMGTMLTVTIRDSGGSNITSDVSEVVASRYNTGSHHASTFNIAARNITIHQRKFISENNVAVVLLEFINNGTTDQVLRVRGTSGLANTGSAGALELTRSGIGVTIGTTVAGRLAGRHGPDGSGARFVATSATNMESGNFTVPAGGTYETALMVVVTAAELPQARQDYEKFLTMNNAELFQYQTRLYNQFWVDELPYIETPNVAVNKAIAYHWWTMRYNSIDPQVPSYGYQFPITIEGVDGYNNAIVLTQGMHIQDTGYMRTGRLAFGSILSAGNVSFSSAYYDNPAARGGPNTNPQNWNSHYSQYIASAGTQVYKIHGGRADIAARLAYDFESDAQGQIDHMGGTRNATNLLLSHNIGFVTGNDGDDRSFFYPSGGRKNRPESAYVFGAFKGASQLWEVAGNYERAAHNAARARAVSTQIQNIMWCAACGTFEVALDGNNMGTAFQHANGNTRLIRVKSNNLLNIFSEYSVPLVGSASPGGFWGPTNSANIGATYKDGLRYAMYNDEFGIFPYYTGNSNDRFYNSAGTHNHSNINLVTLTRGYIASFKYYDREQQFIKGDYLARVFDWHAWHISQSGDLSRMNNQEFYAYGTGSKSGYGTTFDVNRRSPDIPTNDPRQNPNPFYQDPFDKFRFSIDHNILGNFNWLFFEGMAGLNPRLDNKIDFQPTDIGYNYFIVDHIRYHGNDLTVSWVRPGVPRGGLNYTYPGTENWDTIPAEIFDAYPQGFTVYMNGIRLYTIDDLAWVVFDPNTGTLEFQGGETAEILYQTTTRQHLPAAVDVDLTLPMDEVYGVRQLVDNFKLVGIDLTQDGQDLTQHPIGGGTVTPSASFTATRRTQGWNDTGTTHQHMFWHNQATHAEGIPTVFGPIKGTSVNAPHWSNHSTTPRTSDWYQVIWSVPQTFNTLKLFFFDDFRTAAGSFDPPESYTVQYLNAETGSWEDVPNQLRNPGTPMPNFNQINFEEVTSTGLRVTVTNRANRSVAISGFQVFDAVPATWENSRPVIEALFTEQVEDMEVILAATVRDDGFPQILGRYAPIYKWEIINAPAGVEFELIDYDQARARIVATLPDGADENTWQATFEVKFTMWDGDPELYLEHPEYQRPFMVYGTLNAILRSRPDLRDVITSYYPVEFIVRSLETLPAFPAQALAYFTKSAARYVDVTWPSEAEMRALIAAGDPDMHTGVVIPGKVDLPFAPDVLAKIYLTGDGLFVSRIYEFDVEVVAGEAFPGLPAALPVFARFTTNGGGHDASWLKIDWSQVPASYWISPGSYVVDLDVTSDLDPIFIDWIGLGHQQRVNLTILPGAVSFQLTALAPVTLPRHRIGEPVPELPAAVTATWRGAAVPDAPVAVTWDAPDDLFTTTGTKTITGTVAETDVLASLTVQVVDPLPPTIASITLGSNLVVSRGNNATAQISATAGAGIADTPLTFAWSVAPVIAGNTITNANTANAVFNFSNFGTYVVSVVVTDIYGQSTIGSRYVTVGDGAVPPEVNLTRAAVHTAAEGNIARLTSNPNVRRIANASVQTLYGNGVDANLTRTGIMVTYVNTTQGENDVVTLRITDGTRPGAGVATGWNTWGSAAGTQASPIFAVINWDRNMTINSTRVEWWQDGGGVTLPASATVQYFDGLAWHNVTNMRNAAGNPVTSIGLADRGTWNGVTFDPVVATMMRLRIIKSGTGTGNGAGVGEWEVFGIDTATGAPPAANKATLADAIIAFQALTEADYPEAAWATALAIYDAAMLIFLDGEAVQAAADSAANALVFAIETLKAGGVAEADYSAVNAAIAAAEAVARELFTAASLAILDAAVEAVVPGLPETDQAIVDGFAAAINAAIEGLVDLQPLTTFRLSLNAITRVGRNGTLELGDAIIVNADTDFDMADVTFTVSNVAMATIDGTTVSTLNRAGTVTLTATHQPTGLRHSVTLMIT